MKCKRHCLAFTLYITVWTILNNCESVHSSVIGVPPDAWQLNPEKYRVNEDNESNSTSNEISDVKKRNLTSTEVFKLLRRPLNAYLCCNGLTGDVGDFGPVGPRGPDGPQGYPGDQGPRGHEGPMGPPGDRGDNGRQGTPGETGMPGQPGMNGLPGIKGKRGDVGLSGAPGLPGMPGNPGLRGSMGWPGEKGDLGDRGPIGAPGLPGQNAPPGRPGRRGEQGDVGYPGADGNKGEMGDKGDRGWYGPHGHPGMTGARGAPGEIGDQGSPGMTGLKGITGDPGVLGQRGEDGDRGRDGPPGVPGPSGLPGGHGAPGDPGFVKCIAFSTNLYRDVRGGGEPVKTLPIDHVLINQGSGYQSSSGEFTAPFDGIYKFSAHILGSQNGFAYASFVKRDAPSAEQPSEAELTRFIAHSHIVVLLRRDEVIFIRIVAEEEPQRQGYKDWLVRGDFFTAFSGYMLHPLEQTVEFRFVPAGDNFVPHWMPSHTHSHSHGHGGHGHGQGHSHSQSEANPPQIGPPESEQPPPPPPPAPPPRQTEYHHHQSHSREPTEDRSHYANSHQEANKVEVESEIDRRYATEYIPADERGYREENSYQRQHQQMPPEDYHQRRPVNAPPEEHRPVSPPSGPRVIDPSHRYIEIPLPSIREHPLPPYNAKRARPSADQEADEERRGHQETHDGGDYVADIGRIHISQAEEVDNGDVDHVMITDDRIDVSTAQPEATSPTQSSSSGPVVVHSRFPWLRHAVLNVVDRPPTASSSLPSEESPLFSEHVASTSADGGEPMAASHQLDDRLVMAVMTHPIDKNVADEDHSAVQSMKAETEALLGGGGGQQGGRDDGDQEELWRESGEREVESSGLGSYVRIARR